MIKLMVASDIHGSAYYCKKMLEAFDREQAETLLKTRAFNYRGKKTILRNIALLEEETLDGK